MTVVPTPGDAAMPACALPHLATVLHLKYGAPADWGWGPRLRGRFGYHTPDDWYEATVSALVGPDTDWLDVGCGRNVFPFNRPTARMLAERCRLLVGLDPSDNIDANTLVHERARCLLEEYHTDRRFDLVTLRMVAEHIARPEAAVAALGRLTRAGGRVVVYTVHKWSPAALAAAVMPFALHVAAKRLLWSGQSRDTFPTVYGMNTRPTLRRLFDGAGFVEEAFHTLADTRSFGQWKWPAAVELAAWRVFRACNLQYPETCLLGIYRKQPATG